MISVIIPARDAESLLLSTLAALVPGAVAGLLREVIVADGGSGDATTDIADLAGCRIVSGPADPGARLRAAAAEARGPWLMIVRPGLVPQGDWIGGLAAFMEANADGRKAAVFRRALPDIGSGTATALLSVVRHAVARRAGPGQGLVLTRRLYDDLGGHRANLRDPEADLLARLGRRRIAILSCSATAPR